MTEHPRLFTLLWLVFTALWGARSVIVRRGRKYSRGKTAVDKNSRYKFVSHLVYVCQVVLVIPMFWFSSSAFLNAPLLDSVRICGFAIIFSGLLLSVYALIHLGRNYSPCYDAHSPFELIATGPYQFIRHPGWLAKISVGIGTLAITGSLWFVPMLVWLMVEMVRTIRIEERSLLNSLPGYREYYEDTFAMIPMIY